MENLFACPAAFANIIFFYSLGFDALTHPFVQWFRQALPYIQKHRHQCFVIAFGGEALAQNHFIELVQDCALLHSLGIHLVLVPGCRYQVESCLLQQGHQLQKINGLRITDKHALSCLQQAVGQMRIRIESLFARQKQPIPVVSGNWIIAKPLGIIDGIDYLHTGELRKVQKTAIQNSLDQGTIVLLPPLGYSPSGELFNLNAADIAAHVAVELQANKLIFLLNDYPWSGSISFRPTEAERWLQSQSLNEEQERVLKQCIRVCRQGVKRSHILSLHENGALLRELFTRDGSGCMITEERWEKLRPAQLDDVPGILELITPLEKEGILVRRSREYIEAEIERFTVIEREQTIIGCAALYPFEEEAKGELACLAIHPQYRKGERGDQLLQAIEEQAQQLGLQQLFVLTTRTAHWFLERGFQPADLQALPQQKQKLYNWQRHSKLFIKSLTANEGLADE